MQVCQAKYSDVAVWVLNVNGVGVMRRQKDGWVNATHLLKVANFDKPRRTRILERDVQSGTHEKVQGGYGKYQGTWVPLDRGRELAREFGVLDAVVVLLDFEPKENEALPPPPAPARRAVSVTKPPAPKKARKSATVPAGAVNVVKARRPPVPKSAVKRRESSSSSSDEDATASQQQQGPSYMDQYSNALLDLFMSPSNDTIPEMLLNPRPGYHINQPIDDEGHSVFHWASAMGQIKVMQALIDAGARVDAVNNMGQTPLVRAVQFTNNYDLRLFPHVLDLLKSTLFQMDNENSTILHQIAHTTSTKLRGSSARYYLETAMSKMVELRGMEFCTQVMNAQDTNGDTPLHIAARNASRKLVKIFLSYNASTDIRNNAGRTAHEYICEYEAQRQTQNIGSSSPTQPTSSPVRPPYMRQNGPFVPHHQHLSEAALNATRQAPALIVEHLEELALTYDSDLKDRESDIEQVRSLLTQVRKNTHDLKQQIPDLMVQLGPEDVLQAKMANAALEIQSKSQHLRKIVERSQARDLAMLVQEHEMQVHDTIEHQLMENQRGDQNLWHILVDLQQQRKGLVNDIVELYSTASSGDKINKYRKLVSMGGGVDINEIDDLLDIIAQALEDKQ